MAIIHTLRLDEKEIKRAVKLFLSEHYEVVQYPSKEDKIAIINKTTTTLFSISLYKPVLCD